MSRVCQVSGRGTSTGHKYARRGLAKAKGGVGRKVTGKTKRQFKVNLIRKRIWVPELKRYVRVRISAKARWRMTKARSPLSKPEKSQAWSRSRSRLVRRRSNAKRRHW